MKKLIKPLVVLFAIAAVALVAAGLLITRSTHSSVTALRQEITQNGDPLYFADFQPQSIDGESNGYFHLMNAKEEILAFNDFLMEGFNGESEVNFNDPKKLSKSTVDRLVTGIEVHKELFDQIERMAACEQYQADLDFTEGMFVSLPHLNLFTSIADSLQAKTVADVSQQRGDEAIRNCISGMRISRLLMNEPILVSFLVAIGLERTMLDSAFYVISSTPTSAESRAELALEIANSAYGSGVVRVLKGERSCGIQTFKDIREGNNDLLEGADASRLIPGFGFERAYLNDDEAKYIEFMNAMIASAAESHGERVRVFAEISQEIEDSGFRFMVTKLILPGILAVTEVVDQLEVKAGCLQVILRLQAEGEVALEDLPEDPFSGKPLLAKQTEQGWTVYSVGANQQDDKGDLGTPGQNWRQKPDIGYGPALASPFGENEN